MKTIKRWTTAIISSFDQMAAQVENHEALIDSAIREVQESSSRARVQLSRVKRDGEQLRRRLLEQREAAELWAARAKKAATLDEQRALECLRRKKRLSNEIAELETQQRAHAALEQQLSKDQETIEERLRLLKQQRNVLRTRQSRAEALKLLEGSDSLIFSEIGDILERWDAKVSQYEYQGGLSVSGGDELESEFNRAEEEDELRRELDQIMGQPPTPAEPAS